MLLKHILESTELMHSVRFSTVKQKEHLDDHVGENNSGGIVQRLLGIFGGEDPMFAFSGSGVKASSNDVQGSEDAQHVFPARAMIKEQVQWLSVQGNIRTLPCKGDPYYPVDNRSPVKTQGLATLEKHGITKLLEERRCSFLKSRRTRSSGITRKVGITEKEVVKIGKLSYNDIGHGILLHVLVEVFDVQHFAQSNFVHTGVKLETSKLVGLSNRSELSFEISVLQVVQGELLRLTPRVSRDHQPKLVTKIQESRVARKLGVNDQLERCRDRKSFPSPGKINHGVGQDSHGGRSACRWRDEPNIKVPIEKLKELEKGSKALALESRRNFDKRAKHFERIKEVRDSGNPSIKEKLLVVDRASDDGLEVLKCEVAALALLTNLVIEKRGTPLAEAISGEDGLSCPSSSDKDGPRVSGQGRRNGRSFFLCKSRKHRKCSSLLLPGDLPILLRKVVSKVAMVANIENEDSHLVSRRPNMNGTCLHIEVWGDPCVDQLQEGSCSAGVSRYNNRGNKLVSTNLNRLRKLHLKIVDLENGRGNAARPEGRAKRWASQRVSERISNQSDIVIIENIGWWGLTQTIRNSSKLRRNGSHFPGRSDTSQVKFADRSKGGVFR
jgi:hypothetical protein